MKFTELKVKGAYLVQPEPIRDERGYFLPTWSQREFAERGLIAGVVQCNVSYNRLKGTLRGMHYQLAPHAEVKLVQCTRGSIYDVVADIRRDSPSYGQWDAAELTAGNHAMLYIPEGCAHGFQTLEDDTDVAYQMSQYYAPQAARGIRWDDPTLSIRWPMPPACISERDRALPPLEQQ